MKIIDYFKNIWLKVDNFVVTKTSNQQEVPLDDLLRSFDFSKFSQSSYGADYFKKEDNTRKIGWFSLVSLILFIFSTEFNYYDFYKSFSCWYISC